MINGGFLLIKVLWQQHQTFQIICETYISYIEKPFENYVIVVFNSYHEIAKSTKSSQCQKFNKKCAYILFEEYIIVSVSKENFLFNENNKMSFINFLIFFFRFCCKRNLLIMVLVYM